MESYGEYNVRGTIKRYYKEERAKTKEDFYTIGYMACDGAYVENRGFPFMSTNNTDYDLVKFFVEKYCPDNTIYHQGLKSSSKVKATNDCYEMRFPPKMKPFFNFHGVFCRKKERRIVGVSKENFLPYMAGVLDGDGFIGVTYRKDCRTPRLRFFVTHESEKFLVDVQEKLEREGVLTTIRQHGPNCYRLSSQNTASNIVFLPKLLPFLKIEKKRNILNRYLEEYV